MDAGSIRPQTDAGVAPDLGTFWVGPWTLKHGWGGPDSQMRSMRDQGVTPAIHHYYWGDDISQNCIHNGCWSDLHDSWKDQAGWQKLTDQLVAHLNQEMQGEPVLIFLETEFNKADLQTHEPLDAMLAEKAKQIKAGYPAAEVVLSLGSWNTPAWKTWDRAAAASDSIGLQGMRGSTRDSAAHYDALYEDTLRNINTARDTFGQPVVLMDLALSTYPEPQYVSKQSNELGQFFENLDELKAAGVEAMVYRSWKDTPMDLANYYGQAERHWGLAYQDGTHKPSAQVWIDGVRAERDAPAGDAPEPAGPFDASFAPSSSSNEWWIQVDVDASSAPVSVHARHNDGTWKALEKQSWGHWAKSFHAPAGGTMTFRATDAHGQQASESFAWLPASNTAPVASFTAATSGLQAAFDATGSTDADGDALSYAWSLGDGGDAQGATLQHTYAASGTYTVTLTANDGQATHVATKQVTVQAPNQAPRAGFEHTIDGLTVRLTSTATDADGDDLQHRWSLGDGSRASGRTTQHTYGAPGTYTVTLTADDGQAKAAASRKVTVTLPAYEPTIKQADGNNPWWIEVHVDQANSVRARHDGGAWHRMDATDWGTWAASFRAPPGGSMEIQATDAHGRTAVASFAWLPEKVWKPSFQVATGSNEWWVDIKVDGRAPSTLLARQGNGAWHHLDATTWGTWAKGFHAPAGALTLRAIDAYGQVHEEQIAWLQADVAFEPKTPSNRWWVEVGVTPGDDVQRVDALIDGRWQRLEPTSWGTWARSIHASGDVVFRATTSDGVATSAPVKWG